MCVVYFDAGKLANKCKFGLCLSRSWKIEKKTECGQFVNSLFISLHVVMILMLKKKKSLNPKIIPWSVSSEFSSGSCFSAKLDWDSALKARIFRQHLHHFHHQHPHRHHLSKSPNQDANCKAFLWCNSAFAFSGLSILILLVLRNSTKKARSFL